MLEEQAVVEAKYKEHDAEVAALKEQIDKLEYQRDFLKGTVRTQDLEIAKLKGVPAPAPFSTAEPEKEIDLAALRKQAQGKQMTDEEKKARGLLYDTSLASAVRDDSEEDDEGACDMEDPFGDI